jgi:hypothetical protein
MNEIESFVYPIGPKPRKRPEESMDRTVECDFQQPLRARTRSTLVVVPDEGVLDSGRRVSGKIGHVHLLATAALHADEQDVKLSVCDGSRVQGDVLIGDGVRLDPRARSEAD